jgi:cullin-associated NEDD8-dissociated protein 1
VTLAGDKANTQKQIQGALCLGEFGKLVDLSKDAQIFQMIQDYFGSQNEQVRQAASISLGKIAIGNPKFFLEKVFQLVTKSDTKQKYLFLNTLREIILHDSECLKDYIKPMQDLLMQQSMHEEESIRSIVAESLGRLFAAYPQDLISTV